MADGLKRSSPERVTAVVPCIGYSRQDKCEKRGPISLKLVANLMQTAGIDRNQAIPTAFFRIYHHLIFGIYKLITLGLITIDLHSASHQGFFDIPVDNLSAQQLFLSYANSTVKKETSSENIIVFSVGVGNVKFVKNLSDGLEAALGIVHFGTLKKGGLKHESVFGVDDVNVIGDVKDKVCILYQDLDDTCSLPVTASEKLFLLGATKVYYYAVHALFSLDAVQKLNSSKIERMVVTNSLDHTEHMKTCNKITVLDLSPLLAEAIRRVYFGESLSPLWNTPSLPFEIVDYQHQKKAPANTLDQKQNQNF